MKRKSHRKSPPVLPGQLDMFASALATSAMEAVAKSRAEPAPPKKGVSPKRSVQAKPSKQSAEASAVLRVQDAAARVGLSVSTLNKMRGDGRGPRFIKLTGKIVGYVVEDLDAWVEKRRTIGEGAR